MSKKCPNCGSENTKKGRYDNDKSICYVCNDCCFVGDPEEFKELTVFDHITESVETLAEKLVYHIYLTDCMQRKRSYWRSTFFPCNNFSTKEKALAATVAELKKEWNK